jgi:hypothetical protein
MQRYYWGYVYKCLHLAAGQCVDLPRISYFQFYSTPLYFLNVFRLVNPLQHSAACRSPKKDKRREAERFENPHQTHLRWLKHTCTASTLKWAQTLMQHSVQSSPYS